MDIEAPVNKLIVVILIASIFPAAMASLNAMNTTGFTTTEIAIAGLFGIVMSIVFLKMILKE